MNTTATLFAASPIERATILRANGVRIHLGVYPGPLYEASRITTRYANRRTPTHRGTPNA